jgi:hypothetical protein
VAKKKKCATLGCDNLAYTGYRWIKGRKVQRKENYCTKCKGRKNRNRNELMTVYHSIKSNAKYRGIEFSLTIEDFKEFCADTNYLALRGRGAYDLTIDRIKSELGYVKGNIQALLHWQNDTKGAKEKRERKGWGQKISVPREKDDPF